MFEKYAEEILNNHCDCELLPECMAGERCRCYDFEESKKLLIEGIEFGYKKANEWHDINELEPSKEQLGKHLLIRMESVIGDTDYDYLVYKYKGESITDVAGVLAWKEIK